jgi:hypothetical protein
MAKNVQRESKFPGLMQDLKPTSTHTHTDTHTPVVKERKTRRVQLLLKESSVDALDAYAKKHDTSRNDIIQNLVEDFINKNV